MSKYALIGAQIGYSFSKLIHTAFGRYEYDMLSLPEEKLRETIFSGEYAGFNITNPYKRRVMEFCSSITPQAQSIGCVNTLYFENGNLTGANTDYFGFLNMAKCAGISFSGKKVLILGSGGAQLTARAAMSDGGAQEIITVSRRGEVNYENVYTHTDVDIIVNATPVGTFPGNGERLIELSRFPKCSGVLDVVYNPLKSQLVLDAMQLGLPCSGGLPMLVGQAAKACELFTKTPLEDADAENVLKNLIFERTNIVLIGMPGCGKTSIGERLGKLTGRTFIDTDCEVEKKAGMSIPDIFRRFGEQCFREMEHEAVKSAGAQTGVIIATGGGVVKDALNYDSLSQNGRIYYVKRMLDKLVTYGRPLSYGLDAVERLEQERAHIYIEFSDAVIKNDYTLEQAAGAVLNDFETVYGDTQIS